MNIALNPQQAWQQISNQEWTPAQARHLHRRAAWAAVPEQIDAAMRLGPQATVRQMFQKPTSLSMPKSVAEVEQERRGSYQRMRAVESPEARRQLQREARQRAVAAGQEMTMDWLEFASSPPHAAYEKWISFLQNIFVVSLESVRNPAWIFEHHQLLRQGGTGSYRDLCRAVSRSTAMILYLDLHLSRASAPNENFARELFELFMLGEGNYTESDVKAAARAFTGYRHRNGEFHLDRNQQDRDPKTIFNRTGRWSGDDVIRLALEEEAAATFLPSQLCQFYLAEETLPTPYIEELGKIWRQADFNLEVLLNRFFTSRIFYEAQFQGNLIKSPLHFHLGLVQDLQLTVRPFPRTVLVSYRQMGQHLYHPPNIRGWVGGRLWANSSTLGARRQLVESLFQPINEAQLNADETTALKAARERGRVELAVSRERLLQLGETDPEIVADRFVQFFLPRPVGPGYRNALITYLKEGPGQSADRIHTAAMAMLQSPEYNLC